MDRRAQRSAVAAALEAAKPHASEAERRAEVDRQLHERVTAQAWAREREWEQVRSRQAAAKARAEAAAAQVAAPAEPVAVVVPAPRLAVMPVPVVDDVDQERELVLEDLTRKQVIDWRVRAAHDHQLVIDHIDRYGETSARRLFTSRFVDLVQRLAGLGHLGLGYTPWGRYERRRNVRRWPGPGRAAGRDGTGPGKLRPYGEDPGSRAL